MVDWEIPILASCFLKQKKETAHCNYSPPLSSWEKRKEKNVLTWLTQDKLCILLKKGGEAFYFAIIVPQSYCKTAIMPNQKNRVWSNFAIFWVVTNFLLDVLFWLIARYSLLCHYVHASYFPFYFLFSSFFSCCWQFSRFCYSNFHFKYHPMTSIVKLPDVCKHYIITENMMSSQRKSWHHRKWHDIIIILAQ